MYCRCNFMLLSTILHRYIGRRICDVNAHLLRIRMPRITRSPRSVTERSYWKGVMICSHSTFTFFPPHFAASEWKSFLVFYIPVVLFNILPMKYYVHVFLLVKAIRILLGECIEMNQVKLAEQLLLKFCYLMEQYYG